MTCNDGFSLPSVLEKREVTMGMPEEARKFAMTYEKQDDNEVPEYVPTRRELKQLAVYWAVEYIANRFWWFVYQQTGAAERRERNEALIHLNRMSEILGSETMEIVWRDAEASFRKRGKGLTDEDWRVFAEGTEQEREAWRDKVLSEEEIAAQVMTQRKQESYRRQ
jgi:hypothetical protein